MIWKSQYNGSIMKFNYIWVAYKHFEAYFLDKHEVIEAKPLRFYGNRRMVFKILCPKSLKANQPVLVPFPWTI